MLRCGIDVGGTTIKGAVFDGEKAIKTAELPTRGNEGREAIFSQIFGVIDALISEKPKFIGISSAGNIDPYRGACVYATDNLKGWTGVELKKTIEARYGIETAADNDAVCALLGEASALNGATDVTMITLGTGVGGASMVGGKVLRGKNFDAARWGHLILEPNGRPCNCGKNGCAESYLSATALLKRGREKIPLLTDCKSLFGLYESGDAAARKVIAEFGLYLNLLLDGIRTALSPEIIILGGGVAQSRETVTELLKKSDDIRFARYGNLAGAYGATLIGKNTLNSRGARSK